MRAHPMSAKGLAIAVLLAAALSLAGESRAQERRHSVYPVVPGIKVRLVAPDAVKGRAEGTVLEVDDRSLLIQPADQPPVRVPWHAITRLEVSQGRRGNARKGALIGAGLGALGVLGSLTRPDRKYTCYSYGDWSHQFPRTCSERAETRAAAILMIPLGALIGHFVKSDAWSPMPLDRVQVGLAGPPGGRGIGLGLSVRW